MKYIDNKITDYLFKNERLVLKNSSHHEQYTRTQIINFLAEWLKEKQGLKNLKYLEIGVRNPSDNFDHIKIDQKFSVDPGFENAENPVDFKLTSDDFFAALDKNEVLNNEIRFDIIFIDGLHLADQVKKDITNSIRYISGKGFIVLHDCNPPESSYARENYSEFKNVAGGYWNGTTWKAFVDYRTRGEFSSCCIDSDSGVGIISTSVDLGTNNSISNEYYEYAVFAKHRTEILNLMPFSKFKTRMNSILLQ